MKVASIVKTIKDELVYGGHLTSFGAISVVLLTLILVKSKPDWFFLAIAFFGAEIIYLYNRYKEYAKNNPWRTDYLKNKIKFIPLLISAYLIISAILLIYSGKINALLFGFFLILLGLLYSVFLKKITKKIIGFKNIFVSFCWAGIVIFSALIASHPIDLTIILIFFYVYFNIFAHEIILDIRDANEDRAEKLLTLPVLLKRNQLYFLVALSSVIAYIFIIIAVCISLLPVFCVFFAFTILYNIYLFKKIDKICEWNIKYLEVFVDFGKILWFIQAVIFVNIL